MVKADIKHNYYADLELPSNATLDDVKKQFRKLALQYHPDRNAGREDEYVPRFQAIQTAHEILSDAVQRQKYDTDRRKAGLYSDLRSPQPPTPGNPYTASSAYPPPPRRTQAGTWTRPQPSPGMAQAGAGTTTQPTGADRFTNFPRGPAPTARKDPAQDRANMFKAWQNMNNAQDRQQQHFRPPQPAAAAPTPHSTGPPPTPQRQRPPISRPDAKLPSEDQIKAGMRHHKAPPPFLDAERAEQNQARRSAFQSVNAERPGVARSNTTRAPRKDFDSNHHGASERPAAEGINMHRRGSEDFGNARYHQRGQGSHGSAGSMPPPPPPGRAPPAPSSASSASSPTGHRPFADPLQHFKSREDVPRNVPFAEANRTRSPYTTFSGEKTAFSSEGLRRSASTRDATKLRADNDGSNARARSTSPLGRQRDGAKDDTQRQRPRSHDHEGHPFVDYSSDDTEDGSWEDYEVSPNQQEANGKNIPRPKDVPRPPSKKIPPSKLGGTSGLFDAKPTANGTVDEGEHGLKGLGKAQKTSDNMYAPPDFLHVDVDVSARPPRFCKETWKSGMMGIPRYPHHKVPLDRGTLGKQSTKTRIPAWAIPSSLAPIQCDRVRMATMCASTGGSGKSHSLASRDATPPLQRNDALDAYAYFRREVEGFYGHVPDNVDLEGFLLLWASTACFQDDPSNETSPSSLAGRGNHIAIAQQCTTGNPFLDGVLSRISALFLLPTNSNATHNSAATIYTDSRSHLDSFTFPTKDDLFHPTRGLKSRSDETINTEFSPEGWSGKFTGSSDYFAPPPPTSGAAQSRQPKRADERAGMRSATTHIPHGPSSPENVTPTRAFGSVGGPAIDRGSAPPSGANFNPEEWQKHFKDASWTLPPLPPQPLGVKPPSPIKSGPGSVKKQPRTLSRAQGQAGLRPGSGVQRDGGAGENGTYIPQGQGGNPESGTSVGVDEGDDVDAMDIDSTPPAQHRDLSTEQSQDTQKEARLYSVPLSTWRQQQEQANGGRKNSSASRRAPRADLKFNTNLDDLRNVEPIASRTATGGEHGLKNLADLGSTLPFASQASNTLPTDSLEPQKLRLPAVPKAPETPHRLSKESWSTYCEAFGAYLRAFHTFNVTMLAHFEARERNAQALLAKGGATWLKQSGDTFVGSDSDQAGENGFGGYMKGVKEDEAVREAWSLGYERRAEACGQFEKFKENVRTRAQAGTLVDR